MKKIQFFRKIKSKIIRKIWFQNQVIRKESFFKSPSVGLELAYFLLKKRQVVCLGCLWLYQHASFSWVSCVKEWGKGEWGEFMATQITGVAKEDQRRISRIVKC